MHQLHKLRFSASVQVFGFVAAGTGGFITVHRFDGYETIYQKALSWRLFQTSKACDSVSNSVPEFLWEQKSSGKVLSQAECIR